MRYPGFSIQAGRSRPTRPVDASMLAPQTILWVQILPGRTATLGRRSVFGGIHGQH